MPFTDHRFNVVRVYVVLYFLIFHISCVLYTSISNMRFNFIYIVKYKSFIIKSKSSTTNMNCLLLLCLTLVIICGSKVNGQQCLDLKPPFAPTLPLRFCEEYSKYGCCTSLDDDRLREMHGDIVSITSINQQMDDRPQTSSICLQYVKTLLCARCSPFSAELFQDVVIKPNKPRMKRIFPGLCTEFCTQLYDSCMDSVFQDYLGVIGTTEKGMDRAMLLSSLSGSSNSDMFCDAVALPPNKSQYCHPIVDSTFGESSKLTAEKVNTAECVCLQSYNMPLRNPVVVTHAKDGSGRLFISEQIGVVKIMFFDGSISQNDFLDIQSKVFHEGNDQYSQLGLLGMTFHPEFKDNNKLYVFYTFKKNSTSDLYIRVEEYRVMDSDADRVDPSTSRVILEIQKYTMNHAGGTLLFGKDGYLYIFTGDDGGDGDAMEISQDLFMYSGKVLRVNVDVTDFVAGKEYSIPKDNPFANKEELGLPEIYAWGLRNPWRCSVDRAKSEERIFCGDVGNGTYEEINIIKKRTNYGWNIKEGTADSCTECLRGLPGVSLTDPIFQYRHTIGAAVIGGNMYRGCLNPNLYGQYIFGDFKTGLFRLKENSKKKTWAGERLEVCPASQCLATLDSQIQPNILAFGEDEDGEIYVLTTSSPSLTSPNGRVYKIVDPIRRGNPKHCKSARPVDGMSAVTGDYLPNVTPYPSKEELSARIALLNNSTTTPRPPVRRQPRPAPGPRRRTGAPRRTDNQRTGPRSRFGALRRLFNRRRGNESNEENRNQTRNQSPRNNSRSRPAASRNNRPPANNRRNPGTRSPQGRGVLVLGGGTANVQNNQGATVITLNGKK